MTALLIGLMLCNTLLTTCLVFIVVKMTMLICAKEVRKNAVSEKINNRSIPFPTTKNPNLNPNELIDQFNNVKSNNNVNKLMQFVNQNKPGLE